MVPEPPQRLSFWVVIQSYGDEAFVMKFECPTQFASVPADAFAVVGVH